MGHLRGLVFHPAQVQIWNGSKCMFAGNGYHPLISDTSSKKKGAGCSGSTTVEVEKTTAWAGRVMACNRVQDSEGAKMKDAYRQRLQRFWGCTPDSNMAGGIWRAACGSITKKTERWECSRSDALPFILAQEWDSDARVGLYSFSTTTKLATLNIVRSRAWWALRAYVPSFPVSLPSSIVVSTTRTWGKWIVLRWTDSSGPIRF